MRTVAALILLSAGLSGSSVLFFDDFSDGTADGWFQPSMIDYEVIDGKYRMSGGYEENHGIAYSGDASGYMSVADYSARCQVIPETGTFFGMMVRFREMGDYNLMLVLGEPHQSLRLYRWHWVSIELLDSQPMQVIMDEEYWVRFEVSGTDFRGRAWTGGEGLEPDWWMVSASDTLSAPGSAALFCSGLSDVSLSCFFDDVEVSAVPEALESTTWGQVKAVVGR